MLDKEFKSVVDELASKLKITFPNIKRIFCS